MIYHNTAATTAAVTNRIVASANMKVGTYTIANSGVPVWSGGALITLTHTTVATTDTLGTVVLVGKNLTGGATTETLTPVADDEVTSTKVFRSITSATGVGWVKAGATEDTIVIGVAAGSYLADTGTTLGGVLVNNSVATAFSVADARGTIITVPASQAAGTYYNLQGVECAGFLKVTTTSTNDVTVFHAGSIPAYATA